MTLEPVYAVTPNAWPARAGVTASVRQRQSTGKIALVQAVVNFLEFQLNFFLCRYNPVRGSHYEYQPCTVLIAILTLVILRSTARGAVIPCIRQRQSTGKIALAQAITFFFWISNLIFCCISRIRSGNHAMRISLVHCANSNSYTCITSHMEAYGGVIMGGQNA